MKCAAIPTFIQQSVCFNVSSFFEDVVIYVKPFLSFFQSSILKKKYEEHM